MSTIRLILSSFNAHELDAEAVAKCICMFIRTSANNTISTDLSKNDTTNFGTDTFDNVANECEDEDTMMVLRAAGFDTLWHDTSSTFIETNSTQSKQF